MKKTMRFLVVGLVALTLSACAGTGTGKVSTQEIKCPACGYAFDAPGGN